MYNLVLSLSSEYFHNENIKRVTDILHMFSYPLNVILKQQHRARININNTTTTTTQQTYPNELVHPKYRSAIYIRNLSENFNKLIVNTMKDVQIASKPYLQLKSQRYTQTPSTKRIEMIQLIERKKILRSNCEQ